MAREMRGSAWERMNHLEIVSFLWEVADLIRDTFRRGHYQDVILALTVLRRLDCVLVDTKEKAFARQAQSQALGLQDQGAQLRITAGYAFYNTSRYDFEKLLADAPHLAVHLRNYIAGSARTCARSSSAPISTTQSKQARRGRLLFQVVERFKNVNLDLDQWRSEESQAAAASTGPQGDPAGALGAGRDSRELSRRRRPGAARRGKRAARRADL
jgi:type I restriction enzyme M protein